jgi:hypothetical protein
MEFHPCNPIAITMYDKWEPLIFKQAATPHAEIEIRLGRKARKGFDTNVGQETFQKVLRALTKFSGWDSTSHTNSTVYYFPGDKRLVADDETDEQVCCIKKRVLVDDFPIDGSPLDARLGISTEDPWEYDGEEESTEQKTRERWSFVRKNLSIDLSIVKGTPDDKDCDQDTTYQIEMEIVDLKKIHTNINMFNMIYKVFDVLKCVEGPCA